MPYGENIDEQGNVRSPVSYDKRKIAATKFQQQQERLPLQDALAMAKLQHEQAALQFQGQSELHTFQKETQLLRESSAYYAGLPVLQKYLDNRVASGNTEFQKGGRGYAEAYANYAAQFPSAIAHNSQVSQDVADNAKVHDISAKIQQGLAAMPKGTTVPEVIMGEHGQTSVHFKAPDTTGTSMEDQLKTGYGLAPNQFKNAQVIARGTADAKGQFAGSDNGPLLQVAAGETKTGQPGLHVMSINEYNAFAKSFGGQPFAPTAPNTAATPTPSATPAPTETPAATPTPTATPETRTVNGASYQWNDANKRWEAQ